MTIAPFPRASAVVRRGDAFACATPDGWQQGRGAFGGLVLGTLARAMCEVARDEGRALRSLGGDIFAPALPVDGSIAVTTLRRGKGMTFLDARLDQASVPVARASAAFSTTRPVRTPPIAMRAPQTGDWREVDVTPMRTPTGAPNFTQHYEYRSTGPAPFSGGDDAICTGWVREREGGDRPLDEAAIVGLVDAWWPAAFSIATEPFAAATIAFAFELFVDPSTLRANVPLAYVGRSVAAHDGLVVEFRELWHGAQIVAMNQQTFAITM